MSSEEETFIIKIFNSYDENNNGNLEREEFCKVFKICN